MQTRWGRWAIVLALLGIGISLIVFLRPGAGDVPPDPGKPRLAVLVVFDQMRGDYLAKWNDLFGPGGFRRLQEEGAWFANCHYPYAATLTSPGHASLVTGTSPYKHGIVANDWYDRAGGAMVTSVKSEKHRPVPMPPDTGRPVYGAAPFRRRAETLGDVLLAASKQKGRVVSLSIKDGAAIMLAALRALCFWFSTSAGQFVSSSHYIDDLPDWVVQFNRGKLPDRWFDTQWVRFRTDVDYVRHSGIDDNPFEGTGYEQGRTFPHPLTGGKDKLTREGYQAMTNSPYGNELLLALAKRAIDTLELGQREHPDLLCLSFSSNDYVGHCWGPDSQEVLDITLRSDRLVKELLEHLDAKVGKGKYLFAISADHGVCPIPEISKSQGKDAGRVPPELLTSRASAFLDETFGDKNRKSLWMLEAPASGIYLNHAVLKEYALRAAHVEKTLAEWLVRQPGVQAAYTRTQLTGGPFKDDPTAESMRLSFHPECSGDVLVVLKPYYQLSAPITSPKLNAYRTSHGSPYEYDTHVPLLVYGPGVRAGVREERVPPQVVAAILARGLGVPAPAQADYAVPPGLLD
jgi:hypothetical protein